MEKIKEFAKAALIRAIKTFFQTFVGAVGTAVILEDVNWIFVLSSSTFAFILSLGTSLAFGLPEVE